MRIGILTVYDSANFGSYLQAYALKKVLENLGHKVKFIKFRNEKQLKEVFFGSIVHPKYFLKNYIFNYKKYKVFTEDKSIFEEIPIQDLKKDTFDIVIIGSDECWNVKTQTFRNKCFYGIDIPTEKKVAFAISCGKSVTEDFKEFPDLVEGIQNLNKIFVRDERTQKNVKELIGKDAEMVCDPTFLIDVKEFDKEYDVNIDKEYLLVYSYNFTEKQKEYIKRFAKEQNLLIVSACFKHSFCDKCINCSPLEFCKLIQNSKYVITTTFHGTIFSILNKKQFISIPSGQKVVDVLNKTGLIKCEFKENEEGYEEFKNKLLEEINFDISQKNILEWRNKSLSILEKLLKE